MKGSKLMKNNRDKKSHWPLVFKNKQTRRNIGGGTFGSATTLGPFSTISTLEYVLIKA